MVWTCEKERSGVCREKDTGNRGAKKKEKEKAEKEVVGCGAGGYGEYGCCGGGCGYQRGVEEEDALWQPE